VALPGPGWRETKPVHGDDHTPIAAARMVVKVHSPWRRPAFTGTHRKPIRKGECMGALIKCSQ
jgi:hypothetical protein